MAQDNSKYTKPGLRESIKKRVMAGSKGGKPGQWSARKASLLLVNIKRKVVVIKVDNLVNKKT